MIPADLLINIRKIEIRTRRRVQDTFAGAYSSVFKGRGIEFEAVRPYQYGDDVRDIDWNVTARMGDAYIKSYHEERELTVFIVVDTSASMFFGIKKRQKQEIATEIGATLALSALINNDKVGLLIFDDKIRCILPPQKGRNHLLNIIKELYTLKPSQSETDLAVGLQAINRSLHQRAIVFFISDFLDSMSSYERDLLITAKKHDFIAITLHDSLERAWRDVGLLTLRDAETDTLHLIDTHSQSWRNAFKKQAQRFHAQRDKLFQRARIDTIDLGTQDDAHSALARFFSQRARRING